MLAPNGLRYLEWDLLDRSIRLFHAEPNKLIAVYENLHVNHISACVFFDNDRFFTGGSDSVFLTVDNYR